MSHKVHCYPIMECGEPLVSVSEISSMVQIYPFYYHQKVRGASNQCLLRQGAAERLAAAAFYLPEGYTLVVLDAWRPYKVQLALYEMVADHFRSLGYSEEKVKEELNKFVAVPSNDPDQPSPHMTGGAVDLTVAKDGQWVQMGTDFDEFTGKARTNWYENGNPVTEEEKIIRENRKLLCHVMAKAGFVNYEEEWWHFEYGTRRWAEQMNKRFALYKGITE